MRALCTFVILGMMETPLGADETTGNVAGTVRYTGKLPAPVKIFTTDGQTIPYNDLEVEEKSKGLFQVVVALAEGPKVEIKKEPAAVVMDQKDMLFWPRVLAVRAGQKVRFENNDLCNHAVSSASTKSDNVFNVTTPQGQPFEFRFVAQKPPILLGCPIHAWMRAYVYVFEHPYFAVTNTKGEFRLEGVPIGKAKISFRHPDTGLSETRTIEVRPSQTTRLDVEWKETPKRAE